jgi:hypothetical protein
VLVLDQSTEVPLSAVTGVGTAPSTAIPAMPAIPTAPAVPTTAATTAVPAATVASDAPAYADPSTSTSTAA